jgi:hypothetical protein
MNKVSLFFFINNYSRYMKIEKIRTI